MKPFTIDVDQSVVDDLRARLARTRLPASVPGSGWRYGTSVEYLRDLIDHWLHRYSWRAAEASLNRMPQFTADVDDVRLHFVHAKGNGPAPLPLLFSHGWADSFWSVHKIIGPLTDPGAYGGDPADAFHLVAPSLPGFGFSSDPARAGVDGAFVADLFTKLMRDVLGYQQFGLQGGDWGSRLVSTLAHRHPSAALGLHLNLCLLMPQLGAGSAPLTPAERRYVATLQRWQVTEGAYLAVQNTKPQSLAVGLNDSPSGLASWILQGFRSYSDCQGDLDKAFTKDELITNLMIYWVTGTVNSSMRLYYEGEREDMTYPRIETPTGFANFPAEMFQPPREWASRIYNVTRWTDLPRGGHFAAVEAPELLVEDIRAFFRPLRAGL
jgi:pimeloyl-ACP methyl ester carboxylesterase